MFKGLKVLELASVLAGPSVGQFFAELGAEVIKVENPKTHGDVTRSWKLPTESQEQNSAYFSAINSGKKSIGIDISKEEGKSIIHRLVEQMDVVLVSYKPGDAEKLGMDYTTLKNYKGDIIYGHITGYGVDDSRVGYDAIIQAESGFMYMNGEPNGDSLKMPVALVDVLAAHQLKQALLLAIIQKMRTGEGDYVTVSLIESAISALVNQATNYLVAGQIPEKKGSAHPNIAPYGEAFSCADDVALILAVGNDKQFKLLCEVLDVAELATDERFENNEQRVKNRGKLNAYLSESFKMKNADEWLDDLRHLKIPSGSILPMNQVFEQKIAKEVVLTGGEENDKVQGLRTFVGKSVKMDKTPHLAPPPGFGQHTKEVLLEKNIAKESEINELKAIGVIS
jgi:crotonobetainyl-CoA:carnitine CoA-transferase CaiB-like acyl-CoA transferase